jgi:membrane protein YqaA with SNARE-associated domain
VRYLLFALLVLIINLAPIFGPPTWAVVLFYRLNTSMNSVAMIIIAVLCAVLGRYLLALTCGKMRNRLKPQYLENLSAALRFLDRGRKSRALYFAITAFSPLPSAQIFEAAGLMGVRLLPLMGAFAFGRTVTYTLYSLGAASIKGTNIGSVLLDGMKSPWGISLQIASLAAIYFITVRKSWPTKKS